MLQELPSTNYFSLFDLPCQFQIDKVKLQQQLLQLQKKITIPIILLLKTQLYLR